MRRHRIFKSGWLRVGIPLAAALALAPPSSADPVEVLHGFDAVVVTNLAGNRKLEMNLQPGGRVEVVPFAPDVVRVRYHFAGLYEREEAAIDKPWEAWPAFPLTVTQVASNHFRLETEAMQVEVDATNRFRVHVHSKQGFTLLEGVGFAYDPDYQAINDTNAYAEVGWPDESNGVSNFPSGFKLQATHVLRPHEAFLGLGDAGGPLDRRGRKIQFWTQDTYQFGEGRTPKYTALPMAHVMNGPGAGHPAYAFGVFFNNPARPVFDLSGTTNWTIDAGDDQMDYFVFAGGTNHVPARVIDRFSELTGRPAMLPKWALGYHQSRHSYGSQQTVQDLADALWTNRIPCDAIYLDIGSQDGFNGTNFQLSLNGSFTNVPLLVSNLSARGMNLVPLVEPCLTTVDPRYPHAASNLYFLKDVSLANHVGTNFLGRISWFDFSITNMAAWWIGELTNYLAETGFAGIWNDLNEPNENNLPLNAIWFLDGRYGGGTNVTDTRKWHQVNKNTYSMWASRTMRDALERHAPSLRPFVLSRSGWPGIQKLAVGWSGDNKSTFDHLRFNNTFGLNVMISGQAWYGHDIGGFVGNTSPELLTRWLQAGSLQPFYRNHNDFNSDPQEPWVFGEDDLALNRSWIEFRYRMMPYLYTLAADSAVHGIPLNTPAAFWFHGDTNTYRLNDDDYMVGPDLLVAPVVEDGARTREVYLPFGANWYDWRNGAFFLGGQTITVPAARSEMPIFVREGAIVPMGPVQRFANEFIPDALDIHIWPGLGRFELYEDDGATTQYLAGAFARTLWTSAGGSHAFSATVFARTGSYDPGPRAWYVIRHDADPVTAVRANGQDLPRYANREIIPFDGWAYDYPSRQLTIRIWDTGQAVDLAADFIDPTDTDGDGMPDWWEQTYFGHPTSASAGGDPDGDLRPNLDEYGRGSHPRRKDVFASAGGFTNMAVAGTFNFWNPSAANMRLVADHQWASVLDFGDAVAIEFKFVANDDWGNGNWGDNDPSATQPPLSGTAESGGADIAATGLMSTCYTFRFNETSLVYGVVDAWTVDSDGDGTSDGWEVYHGFDPLNAADGVIDADGDGVSNADEAVAATGPVTAGQFPRLEGTAPLTFRWEASPGRLYDLYVSTNLVTGPWTLRIPFTNLTGDGTLTVADTNGPTTGFYRLLIRKP